jgi:site-specific DNA-methyltransferase (adenine-specific)
MFALNKIYEGSCIEGLQQVAPGSVDLAFADPPFNIGYEYDVYHDQRGAEEYLDWTRKWIGGVRRVLKPNGTFWLAIGDEYAAELKLIAQGEFGFACRSWVIWYYTFGVNCVRGFSRSHTHLFHFVCDATDFTFNADNPAVRVPSARQLVYADTRANSKGRLPDNTWILRPQDLPGGFRPDHDTWYFPRVAGTFKEREGFHGCQMPEQLLGRIIRCSSNPMDVVLDPFGGSGTTFSVAKKLGRQWLGFELSKDYAQRIQARLKQTSVGDPLDGAADPATSAPSTAKPPRPRRRLTPQEGAQIDRGIIQAYQKTCQGLSADHLVADPERNAAFLEACKKIGVPGFPPQWNLSLMRIRKSGKLPHSENRVRVCTFEQMDGYSFAAEVAMHQLSVEIGVTLDGLLCDPDLAGRFDDLAAAYSPGHSPFEYRWAALALRKRAKEARQLAQTFYQDWLRRRLPRPKRLDRGKLNGGKWSNFNCPGVYVLHAAGDQRLYVGETFDLGRRIERMMQIPAWQRMQPAAVTILPDDGKPFGLQALLIRRLNPALNSRLMVS